MVNETAIAKMFVTIADDDDPNSASMEGISKLCNSIGIDPYEDIRVLVLLWKLGANDKPAQISKEEWSKGCALLQVDSITKFKSLLPSLDPCFLVDSEFKDFYKFAFQFNREGTHRNLAKSLVIDLVQLVLKGRIASTKIDSFIEFLEYSMCKNISLDQWMSFFDFCRENRNLEEYNEETSAFPVMIDEYVEYMRKKKEPNNPISKC